MEINNESWYDKLPPEAKAKLSPEIKQQLQDTIAKMKDNPGIFGMMGAMKDLNKLMKENGGIAGLKNLGSIVDVQSTTVTTETSSKTLPTPSSPAEAERTYTTSPDYNKKLNDHRNASPTFNPDVKGDQTRIKFIIVGLLIIGGYLLYKYGLNEQIPSEILEFFE